MVAFVFFAFILSLVSSIGCLILFKLLTDCFTGEIENKKYYKTIIENYNRKKVQK